MTEKAPKLSTVLTRAAKWIDEHGLAKGDYWKHRNGRPLSSNLTVFEQVELAKEKGCKACTWGGLYIGSYEQGIDSNEWSLAAEEAAGYVRDQLDEDQRWIGVPDWNDKKERTKAEVVSVLKDAAKAARKDGK